MDFHTEREARDYLGDDSPDDGARIVHLVAEDAWNPDGTHPEWWVVRFPRLFTVRTVNTGEGVSCVDSPESLGGFQGHETRAWAWTRAKAHAAAWSEELRAARRFGDAGGKA